jgi:hypothetical protein
MAPITVPFQMSGSGHHLTIREAAGGVELLVASDEIPFTTTFQRLYLELDNWRHFLEAVRPTLPAEVQRQIDAKIAHLRNVRQTQVSRYNQAYNRTWGSRRGEEGHRNPNAEKDAIRQLTEMANADLAEIRAWATGTGMDALSPDAVLRNLRPFAKAAFDRAVALRRAAVDAIIAKYTTPAGKPLRYRGSLAEGKRGPHKAEVRFSPDDFDLDLYVVDAALHSAILTARPALRAEFLSRPIPARTAGGAALTLQTNAVNALEAPGAVPGLRRGANYVLVRFAEP